MQGGSGLTSPPAPGVDGESQMHVMGGLQTTSTGASGGNNSNAGAGAGTGGGGLETDVEVSGATVANVDSHLDSFFATHGVTREDVMVLAAAVQLGMWVALLYLEVSQR